MLRAVVLVLLLHLNCLLLRQVLANPVPPEITSSMSRESIISSVFNMLEESEPEDEELVSIFPRNMEKRNTKLRPMKAVFLKRECCQKWAGCCQQDGYGAGSVTRLQDCIANAAINTTTVRFNNDTKKNETKCRVPMRHKSEAREKYCDTLREIDNNTNILLVLLRQTERCAKFPLEGKYRPTQITYMIELWNRNMVDKHKKCCRPFPSTEGTYKLSGKLNISLDFCSKLWEMLLWWVFQYIETVDQLQSLGRRRQCLRGCFTMGHVDCVINQAPT